MTQAEALARIDALPRLLRDTCAELVGPDRRTVSEVATRYGVSESAIYLRWHRARTQHGLPLPPLGPGGRR